VLFVLLHCVSAMRSFWRVELALVWIEVLIIIGWLMWGGAIGLSYVSQERWGGLPVTLILATFGLALGFPWGSWLPWDDDPNYPPSRLFACSMSNSFVACRWSASCSWRASCFRCSCPMVSTSISSCARRSPSSSSPEPTWPKSCVPDCRPCRKVSPKAPRPSASPIGRGTGLIILPQALRHVIPPLVNTFIAFFKETSLVLIIGIFDLLTAAKAAIIDPAWQSFSIEVYVVVGMIYFLFCFAMSRNSCNLEAAHHQHR